MNTYKAEVLVVGGGTGGTAAAIQAAQRGAKTLLVSEFPWLGGMLTSAGVSAPDGNELMAFQTGIWGEFLRSLRYHQPGGLNNAWVSFFTYEPRFGAAIFAHWVTQLPNLQWIVGGKPIDVHRQGDRLTGVTFNTFSAEAQIILDGTELGDLLFLGDIPYRWGWEAQQEWGEPSAPDAHTLQTDTFYRQYPVQAPTWVVVLQDFGEHIGEQTQVPTIPPPPNWQNDRSFHGAWANHGPEQFLNYGRLPNNRFMINWPIQGNDYGEGADRLVGPPEEQNAFLQESLWHSQAFAHFIQRTITPHTNSRYGLAKDTFPNLPETIGGGAYALHPYYRESRRLIGIDTVTERDILPIANGNVAPLPINAQGQVSAIALGNYANDHHYPTRSIPLAQKSLRWGGRWTGTPFSLPYGCLVPIHVDNVLVCEKNISVSHIANGATRLQPIVLGIGQAAGMAAALCVERNCQPRDLPIQDLQKALVTNAHAPAAVIPFFDGGPDRHNWQDWQLYYLQHPEDYPATGECSGIVPTNVMPADCSSTNDPVTTSITAKDHPSSPYCNKNRYAPLEVQGSITLNSTTLSGQFHRQAAQDYLLKQSKLIQSDFQGDSIPQNAYGSQIEGQTFHLVTLCAGVDRGLKALKNGQQLQATGQINVSGKWLTVENLEVS